MIQALKAKTQTKNNHKIQKNKLRKTKAAVVVGPTVMIKKQKIRKENNLRHHHRHHENFQITYNLIYIIS